MNQSNKDARERIDRQRQHSRLDESQFIRDKLFGSEQSSLSRYSALVFHSFSWPKLIRYELLTTFIGPLPGALGLALRKRLFRGLFRKTGKGVIFGANLTLRHVEQITLGDGVMLDRDCVLDARGAGDRGIVIGDRVIVNRGAAIQAKVGHIEIGANCNIGAYADLVSQGPIIIEENVSIAGKVTIAGGRYVVEVEGDSPEHKRRFTLGTIRIGRNTRIGIGAIIQDGVTIGENSIVAPGSVVYESVPANTVLWGNPARILRKRPGAPNAAPAEQKSRPDSAEPVSPAVRQQVCEYLENDLFIEFGPGAFGLTDSLIDAGILDSLALVRLLLWIEEKFQIDLDFASLDPADIDSVEKIVARVHQRTGA
ncbi:MAG: DapH/DapD/GlmU-related protein [Woeseia sp.]